MVSFIYKGKNYTTNNLENKLKKMGITEKDIVIPNKKDIGTIAEYKEKGYIKHAWINENPESPEYKYSVIGIHLPDKVPNKPNYLNEDWIYYEKI